MLAECFLSIWPSACAVEMFFADKDRRGTFTAPMFLPRNQFFMPE
jgi:hypothetical protein